MGDAEREEAAEVRWGEVQESVLGCSAADGEGIQGGGCGSTRWEEGDSAEEGEYRGSSSARNRA